MSARVRCSCGSRPLPGCVIHTEFPSRTVRPARVGPVVADGRITGVVTSGAADSVLIEGADQCGHAIARSVTPVDGYFSFVGLLPGTYRLTVDGRAPVQIALGPGAMDVNGVTF